jgi:hypothetical protein
LKIWKPALYKKSRSVQRTAEGEIHSRPGQWPDRKIRVGEFTLDTHFRMVVVSCVDIHGFGHSHLYVVVRWSALCLRVIRTR